jgi:hypothetical protein
MLLIGLGLALLAAACGTVPPPAAAPARGVHLVVVNLCDCTWQITIAPAGGGPAIALHIAGRESQEADLQAGAYEIVQTAAPGSGGAELTRRFTVRLEPGQTYRWRLVTLLSAPANGAPANDTQ